MLNKVSILFIVILFSCSKRNIPTAPATQTGPVKTYLALGDSYTIGQSVAVNQRFPAQTVAILRAQGINIAEPLYIAQTGWTTANLQNAIANQSLTPTYDVVTLLIGVNDQYQRMDTSGYAVRFRQLLEKSIELAKGIRSHVFVLSIPDYSVTPFVSPENKSRVRTEIDLFNDINRRITAEYNISYTDITPSSRQAATDATLIANDNLHPSGLEYKKWAEMLAPKIKAALQ